MKENEDEEQKEQNKQNEQNKQKEQNKQNEQNKQKQTERTEQTETTERTKKTTKQQKKPVRTEPKGTLTTNDHPVLTHRCAQFLIIPRMQLHQLYQDTFPLRAHGTTMLATTPPTTFTTFTTGTCFNGTAGGGSIEIHPEPVESEEAAAVTAQKHCRTKVPPKKREIIE
jgi:Fe2+ transport system protein B